MTAFIFISINHASMRFFECPLDTGTRLINVPVVSVLVIFHRMIFLNLNRIHKLVVVNTKAAPPCMTLVGQQYLWSLRSSLKYTDP